MSRHLHLDLHAGIAGDMLLGLLVDLGLPPAVLEGLPARLGLDGVTVSCGHVERGSLRCGRVHVDVRGWHEPAARVVGEHGHGVPYTEPADAHEHPRHAHDHDHPHGHDHEDDHGHPHGHDHDHEHGHGATRGFVDVQRVLAHADLPERARTLAERAFARLFAAEAKVHGRTLDEVHLHEAGADDALIDVVGTALGLVELGVTTVSCAVPLPVGGGSIHCAHGILPVPGPAVAALLEGLPVVGGPVARELITPTGAALLRAIVDEFRALPEMTIVRAGHGAGTYDREPLPSTVRGVLGERAAGPAGPAERELAVLETALDDVLPQDVPVLVERMLAAGARDALVVPVQMKKGRPGFLLLVVADPGTERGLAALLLRESPTLGVRIRRETRLEWNRDVVQVDTPWGPVGVKRALDGAGRPLRGQPEFEDCRRAADAAGVTVDEVRRRARAEHDAGNTHE